MTQAWRRVAALARNDLRMVASDPVPTLMLPVMAVGLTAFLTPAFRNVIEASYGPGFNGAEQAVPGMAVMFAFFLVANGAFGVFREHGWNTWTRLRASALRPSEVLVGKAVLPFVSAVAYFVVLFAAGFAVFGLQHRGSLGMLAVVSGCFAVCLATLSLAMVAVSRTVMQVNALGSVTAMLFAGLGGALTPREVLPGWARPLGPISPGYWAMEGYRAVLLDGSAGRAATCALVLVGFGVLFGGVAVVRFRFDEHKVAEA
jgi:ABC-2 type transport system permease protein